MTSATTLATVLGNDGADIDRHAGGQPGVGAVGTGEVQQRADACAMCRRERRRNIAAAVADVAESGSTQRRSGGRADGEDR